MRERREDGADGAWSITHGEALPSPLRGVALLSLCSEASGLTGFTGSPGRPVVFGWNHTKTHVGDVSVFFFYVRNR